MGGGVRDKLVPFPQQETDRAPQQVSGVETTAEANSGRRQQTGQSRKTTWWSKKRRRSGRRGGRGDLRAWRAQREYVRQHFPSLFDKHDIFMQFNNSYSNFSISRPHLFGCTHHVRTYTTKIRGNNKTNHAAHLGRSQAHRLRSRLPDKTRLSKVRAEYAPTSTSSLVAESELFGG